MTIYSTGLIGRALDCTAINIDQNNDEMESGFPPTSGHVPLLIGQMEILIPGVGLSLLHYRSGKMFMSVATHP